MCKHAIYKHPMCRCQWLQIIQACAPGMGFSTCETFNNNTVKRPPPLYMAHHTALCPRCDMEDDYDRNTFRMVVAMRKGMRWGTGPSRRDPGWDIRCEVM